MPYRAQLGGVFGSGLYPGQPVQDNVGNAIDAVTRGATTLIQSAYARKQAERQQAIQDAERARQDREEQRKVEQDTFNRDMANRKDARETEAQSRADAAAGYTPTRIENKDVVEPGTVETNGLMGAPGKVTAPKVTQQSLTIPGALDYTKSNAYRARAQTDATKEKDRTEHISDSEKIHADNRAYDVKNPLPSRASSGAGDQSAVHASTAVRGQLNEVNVRVKALEAKRAKLAPDQIPQDKATAAAIDAQLTPLVARRDSLQTVNDRVAGKLTANAGVDRSIRGALSKTFPAQGKPDGSTVRDGSAPNPQKRDGSTVRTGSGKTTISREEAKALKDRGFSDKQIATKYLIQ